MDQVLLALNSFPKAFTKPEITRKDEPEIKAYELLLNQLSANAITAIVAKPSQILKNVDPSINSIGYLIVLNTCIGSESQISPQEWPLVLNEIVQFILHFNPIQVRYVGPAFRSLVNNIGDKDMFTPAVAIELLTNAILRLDPTGSTFTSSHYLLLKLAVESALYEPALEISNRDILSFPQSSIPRDTLQRIPRDDLRETIFLGDKNLSPTAYLTPEVGLTDRVRATTVLEYNLFRALIFISQRDWQKAFNALEHVLVHPTKERGVSKIMADAHKKWTLVGVLCLGKSPTLPTYVSAAGKNTYNALGATYTEIADAFTAKKVAQLKALVAAHTTELRDDGNISLVEEVISSYQKWQIKRLGHVYSHVEVSEILRLASGEEIGDKLETEADILSLVQGMVDSGMLKAKIEVDTASAKPVTYLIFEDSHSTLSEADYARELARCHQSVQSLTARYKETDEKLAANKEYIKFLVQEQKRPDKEALDPGVGFDSQIEDEDLMTGIMAHG